MAQLNDLLVLGETKLLNPLSIANGGTGATEPETALKNLTIINNRGGARIGKGAMAVTGGAVGGGANTTDGGAMGCLASAMKGGAVGQNATAIDGFAGGDGAKALVGGAVQLGEGTNKTDNTLQFRDTQIVNEDGKIVSANLDIEDISNDFIEIGPSSGFEIIHCLVFKQGNIISGHLQIEGEIEPNTSSTVFTINNTYIPKTYASTFVGLGTYPYEDSIYGDTVRSTPCSFLILWSNFFIENLSNNSLNSGAVSFTYMCN